MNVNQSVPAALLRKREEEAEIKEHPEFDYVSSPGDGVARYVFQRRVCLGRKEALAYVRGLREQARYEEESEAREAEAVVAEADLLASLGLA